MACLGNKTLSTTQPPASVSALLLAPKLWTWGPLPHRNGSPGPDQAACAPWGEGLDPATRPPLTVEPGGSSVTRGCGCPRSAGRPSRVLPVRSCPQIPGWQLLTACCSHST